MVRRTVIQNIRSGGSVSINGKKFVGRNIIVDGDVVTVDGVVQSVGHMKSSSVSTFFQFATIGLAIAFLFTGALGHGLNPGWLFAAAAMLTALLSLYARYPGMRVWHVALAFAVVFAAGLLLLMADPVLVRVLSGVVIALVLPVTAGVAWRHWA